MSGQTAYGNKLADAGFRRTWDKEGKSLFIVSSNTPIVFFRIRGEGKGKG